jgi:hypothetical protein
MTHWRDPVVEEVRCIREQQAAELNFDLKAIFERARRRQEQSKHETVSLASSVMIDEHLAAATTSATG